MSLQEIFTFPASSRSLSNNRRSYATWAARAHQERKCRWIAIACSPPLRRRSTCRIGDAFAHTRAHAAEIGRRHVGLCRSFGLPEFAVILEPEEPLASARRAFYGGSCTLRRACRVGAAGKARSPSNGRTRSTSTADSLAAVGLLGLTGRDGGRENQRRSGLSHSDDDGRHGSAHETAESFDRIVGVVFGDSHVSPLMPRVRIPASTSGARRPRHGLMSSGARSPCSAAYPTQSRVRRLRPREKR
jgi:hypothetical protein